MKKILENKNDLIEVGGKKSYAELLLKANTDIGTDDTTAITPLKLKNSTFCI